MFIFMKKFSHYLLLVLLVTSSQTVSAETRYRVQASDNLNGIVERFYKNSDLSKGQLMVGVLAKNPRAFRGGNINFLLRGKRLTLPDDNEIKQISPEIASQLLSQHARFFRIGITGDLDVPRLDELSMAPDVSSVGSTVKGIMLRQDQTKKIDQLQQESTALKKQLEELLNDKGNRDNRLLEIEKSLKQTQNTEQQGSKKQITAETDSIENLENTSEPAKSNNASTDLKSKVEDIKVEPPMVPSKPSIGSTIDEIESSTKTETPKKDYSTGSSLSKLLWLLPLILLAGFLFRYFGKKQAVVDPKDDTIAHYEAEYLAAKEDIDPEFEEEDLETSIKLDVARAYIEAEDTPSALDILTEIMEEGSDEQRQQAHELLDKISPS